jgi:DNA-binding Lrp family transcriptional regulator
MECCLIPLDDLDKKILQQLSIGICSYEDLANQCKVTRNTVYRRIALMEDKGIIKNTTSCIINLDQLDIIPISIAVKINSSEINTACKVLASYKSVRLLFRSFGDYNLNIIAFSQKGDEGKIIQTINRILEDFSINDIKVSVGFIWEKIDLSTVDLATFSDKLEVTEEPQIIQRAVS